MRQRVEAGICSSCLHSNNQKHRDRLQQQANDDAGTADCDVIRAMHTRHCAWPVYVVSPASAASVVSAAMAVHVL